MDYIGLQWQGSTGIAQNQIFMSPSTQNTWPDLAGGNDVHRTKVRFIKLPWQIAKLYDIACHQTWSLMLHWYCRSDPEWHWCWFQWKLKNSKWCKNKQKKLGSLYSGESAEEVGGSCHGHRTLSDNKICQHTGHSGHTAHCTLGTLHTGHTAHCTLGTLHCTAKCNWFYGCTAKGVAPVKLDRPLSI